MLRKLSFRNHRLFASNFDRMAVGPKYLNPFAIARWFAVERGPQELETDAEVFEIKELQDSSTNIGS